MRTYLLGICILVSAFGYAQRECATSHYIDQLHKTDPLLQKRINETELFINSKKRLFRTGEEGSDAVPAVIRIPVVVHILYNKNFENISEAQVKSQIDVLNKDFRRLNADTVNTPARFKHVAADVAIEFVLATADPEGRPTNGIVRKRTNVTRWKSDDKIKFSSEGGSDAWDSHSYLNIWVGNTESLIGYASVPGVEASKDGVVIAYTAFGTINSSAPYNRGRTTVHEVGHWLGLRHIWGDTFCGNDMVDDTPVQGNFTPGCPSVFRSSCSNGSQGDMYMNYMDYTDDACMNLFTIGQAQRMRTLFDESGLRSSLLKSKGLNQPWTAPLPQPEEPFLTGIRVYPNPVVNNLTLEVGKEYIGKMAVLSSLNGTVLSRVLITYTKQNIQITHLPAGMYFLQINGEAKTIREKIVKL